MSTLPRWRLVLGRFAEAHVRPELSDREQRMEAALDFLYSRGGEGRGIRGRRAARASGSLDPSAPNVPQWLGEVRELFPRDVVEVVERHALERYGMTELVTDDETLRRMQPSMELLQVLLTFRGQLHADVLATARRIVRAVVEDIRRRIEAPVRGALASRRDRFRHSPRRSAQDFDWRGTLRAGLGDWDPERRRMMLRHPRFFARNSRHMPWEVILCVDQSGSMASSVIHSAVMAGVLAGLPLLRVSFVAFDTSVVDLSDHVGDPVEMLMSVQLGGGTNIGSALAYCETLVQNPHRTVLVLVSDFCEGGSPNAMLAACRRLRESGVRLLGLASLDMNATPIHDRQIADRLADVGMDIAALTPAHLAEWLARVVHAR